MTSLQSSLSAGRLLAVAAFVGAGITAHAQFAISPGDLLEPYVPGSNPEHVVWTDLSNNNTAYYGHTVSSWKAAGAYLDPDSGTGTLQVLLGGYPATFGIYAWANDFGLLVSQSASTITDIKSVVVQIEQIGNPDFYEPGVTGVPDDLLFYNYIYATYPAGHTYNSGLDALISTGRTSYIGGPVLRYDNGGGVTVLQADPDVAELVNDTIEPLFGGYWFNFVYQFDLSGLSGVDWVQVAKPSVVHEATTAVKISIADSFVQITP